MKDGVTLNMTYETPEKQKFEKNLPFINPEATNNNMTNFMVAFSGLSKNKLKGLHKTVSSNIDLPPDD